jgi:hypothetical protein
LGGCITDLVFKKKGGNDYGVVTMKEEIIKEWEDNQGVYPYARATLYIYCDKCGSFNIESTMTVRQWLLIISASVFMIAGILVIFLLGSSIYWLLLCLAVCVLAFRYFWGNDDYRCKNCGDIPRIDSNTRDYPSNKEILDVPEHFTQKRFWEYFPDSYSLGEALKSPKGIEWKKGTDNFPGDVKAVLQILAIPLVAIVLMVGGVFFILWGIAYPLWTEILSKPFSKLFSRGKGH